LKPVFTFKTLIDYIRPAYQKNEQDD